MPTAPIALTAATGNTTLVSVAADRTFTIDELVLISDAAGVLEVRSGSTPIVPDFGTIAGAQYTFAGLKSQAAGDDIILNRTDSAAISGYVRYRVK